jgi:dTDP-4-dehydrorhamnose 3,5-epimerase
MKEKINGVEIKGLVTHEDERGFFREIIRSSDDFFIAGFGQLSHSIVYHNVVKAWHLHNFQSQLTYAASGTIRVVLHDTREDSSTHGITMEFLVGENAASSVYLFPSGVAHGYKCVNGPANIIYVTSGEYDLDDEQRIPHDDSKIGYNWQENTIK